VASGAEPDDKPVWLVVGRPGLLEAIKPLDEYRSGEGFRTVVSTEPIAVALKALGRRPAFLLLVGDDEPGRESEPWYLAAKRMKAYRWGRMQPGTFASDMAWGDLDGDLLPEVPVGRIPARTREQVELVVRKTLAFERRQPTVDDLRLPVWAGSPGFGGLVDSMTTHMLVSAVCIFPPRWVNPWIISSDAGHPLCGWPADQPGLFTRQIRRGGVMTILIGHGSRRWFVGMDYGGQSFGYSAAAARDALAKGPPGPPLTIIACHTGDFARSEPSLGEQLLMMPAGPVATIGATTESHPLTNYYSGVATLRNLESSGKRLGSLWFNSQRAAMKLSDKTMEQLLNSVEGNLEPRINVARLKRDQMLLYALLGDPATGLKLPAELKVSVERIPSGWRWKAERPKGATTLEVGLRADGQSFGRPPSPLEPEASRELQREANRCFAYLPQGKPLGDVPWEGTVRKSGWLRLVATAPGRLYVATARLDPSEKPAADK
ncbi:MAG: hypothetical protein GWP05_09405, partial [Anaerolineaceae bacterium]|nr:hypothetical protein [Anaerolineaceae bacterium]